MTPRSKSPRIGDRVTLSSKLTELQNSRDQIDPSVDIDRAAGDPPGKRRRQIRAGGADIHDVDEFSERGLLCGFVQQELEILQTGRGPRLERTRRNRVNPIPCGPSS